MTELNNWPCTIAHVSDCLEDSSPLSIIILLQHDCFSEIEFANNFFSRTFVQPIEKNYRVLYIFNTKNCLNMKLYLLIKTDGHNQENTFKVANFDDLTYYFTYIVWRHKMRNCRRLRWWQYTCSHLHYMAHMCLNISATRALYFLRHILATMINSGVFLCILQTQ